MSFTSGTILVALELSNSLWLVDTRMAGVRSSQMHRVSAGDTVTLLRLLDGLLANGREQGAPTRIENRISALLVTKVSARGHHCAAGSETWRSLRPATDASFPNILYANSLTSTLWPSQNALNLNLWGKLEVYDATGDFVT